jgi:DNA-binding LacI/PurR family transcriptional regulator
LIVSDNEEKLCQDLIANFKERKKLPDAFFCTTQTQSKALIRVAGKMGWTVPDDFMILAYGNSPEFILYSAVDEISCIQRPYIETGAIAVDLITRKISSGTDIPDITTIKAKLVHKNNDQLT